MTLPNLPVGPARASVVAWLTQQAEVHEACAKDEKDAGVRRVHLEIAALNRASLRDVMAMGALENSLRLADNYIALCPCDPDVFPDQWRAWQAYSADRRLRATPPQPSDP